MIVDAAAYIDGIRHDLDPSPSSLAQWTPSDDVDGFMWLGLNMPGEAELQPICEALQFDEVEPEEVLRPHSRPVLMVDGPTLQLVLRTARYDDRAEAIMLGEMTLLVGPHAIVTVRHGQASQLSKVRAELEADPERLDLGPSAVVAAVVEQVIRDYGPALDGFETDAIEVEREVFSDTRRQPVQRLYKLKREVRRLLVAIDSLQDPLNRLIRVLGHRLPREVVADLSESADQLDRAVTRANSLSDLLDAALTASLTQTSVQQNDDMRKISAWVAMAAVPTLVAGIYGMNFTDMPELRWNFGYPAVLVMMAIIVALLYRSFKRSGWL